jgi:hypothetical protein
LQEIRLLATQDVIHPVQHFQNILHCQGWVDTSAEDMKAWSLLGLSLTSADVVVWVYRQNLWLLSAEQFWCNSACCYGIMRARKEWRNYIWGLNFLLTTNAA